LAKTANLFDLSVGHLVDKAARAERAGPVCYKPRLRRSEQCVTCDAQGLGDLRESLIPGDITNDIARGVEPKVAVEFPCGHPNDYLQKRAHAPCGACSPEMSVPRSQKPIQRPGIGASQRDAFCNLALKGSRPVAEQSLERRERLDGLGAQPRAGRSSLKLARNEDSLKSPRGC